MKDFIGFVSLYLNDSKVRFNVGVLFGLVLNCFYIVFNLIYGIKYENAWFVTVSVYYTLIVILRYFAIDSGDGGSRTENEALSGILMLILSAPMTGMIFYTVITNSSHTTPKSTLPVFAVYAFYSILRAVFGLFSSKNREKKYRRNAHAIRLSLALLSLFNLQTSLFSFLGVRGAFVLTVNFITGGATSLSILWLARGYGAGYFKD